MPVITDEEKDQMLSDLDKIHNPDEVEDLFGEFLDSRYQVALRKIYFHKPRGKEQIKLVIEFEVLSGTYKNRTIYKWCNMETAQNLDFLTNDLHRLGIKKFKWSTLESHFPSLLDKTYEIELVTKGNFQNVYIQKEINVTIEAEPKRGIFGGNRQITDSSPDDDIPF